MTVPQKNRKYESRVLATPEDFIRYLGLEGCDFPSKYILVYQSPAFRYFLRNYAHIDRGMGGTEGVAIHNDVAVLKMSGFGAPHAATVMEELIVLGGRSFINLGTAGGLQDGFGVVLCDRAIRDEGVSYHYIRDKKYIYPSEKLTAKLSSTLTNLGIEHRKGTSWTTDAFFRTTLEEYRAYRGEGVETVEMEAAALFAVAEHRGVDVASVFAVSDLVKEDGWDKQFHNPRTEKDLENLVDAAVVCLSQ